MTHVAKPIGTRNHRLLCSLLLAGWDNLVWRHHGLGMLQAYIEKDGKEELRVHIWHPDLVSDNAAFHGGLHDHRFDMRSTVLYGTVPHNTVMPVTRRSPTHEIWEVVNARKAGSDMDEADLFKHVQDTAFEEIPNKVHEGYSYRFPKRSFHATFPITGMAITLVEKMNQEEAYARIMVPKGEGPPKHLTRAGEEAVTQEQVDQILRQAAVALQGMVAYLIQLD